MKCWPAQAHSCVWRMTFYPKETRLFLSLPVRRNIARRCMQLDTICPICKRFDDDCRHIFFKCKHVKQRWWSMNMEAVRIELMHCQLGIEKISNIWEQEKSKQVKVIGLLWRWWLARNKVNDCGRVWCAAKIHGQLLSSYLNLKFWRLMERKFSPNHSTLEAST